MLIIGLLDDLLPIASASGIGLALLLTVLAGIREQHRGRLATAET